MDECPNAVITLSSHTTAARLPRTPSQLTLDPWDSRAGKAIPTYELPSPDLMDRDMMCMIAVRIQPGWNKGREDRHWEQVRRERNAAWRRERSGDRDECTIMWT